MILKTLEGINQVKRKQDQGCFWEKRVQGKIMNKVTAQNVWCSR